MPKRYSIKFMRLLLTLFFSLVLWHCDVAGNDAAAAADALPSSTAAPSPAPSVSLAPTVASSPTAPPTPSPTFVQPECYNNLTVLAAHMLQKNPFEPTTYHLCPNTVFEIGFESADNGILCCIDGQSPILPRSNARIYCGNDGDPANNCTLVSGEFQVLSSYLNFFENTINFEIRGVTFVNPNFASAFLSNGGDIAFKDCSFRDNNGVSTVLSFHSPPGATSEDGNRFLRLKEDNTDVLGMMDNLWERVGFAMKEYKNYLDHEKGTNDAFLVMANEDSSKEDHENVPAGQTRKLDDTPDWMRQEVLFEGCDFFRNKQGERGGEERYGIITAEAEFDDIEIRNCHFHDNDFGNPLDARGYAVFITLGSKLSLSGNCFVNNNLIGEGVVIVESGDDLLLEENNFVTEDDGLQCPFIALQEPQDGDLTCIGSPVEECSIPGVNPPPENEENDDSNNTGVIVGAVVGGVAFVVLAALGAVMLLGHRRRQTDDRPLHTGSSPSTIAEGRSAADERAPIIAVVSSAASSNGQQGMTNGA